MAMFVKKAGRSGLTELVYEQFMMHRIIYNHALSSVLIGHFRVTSGLDSVCIVVACW